jgi:hypothetical protein
MLRLELRQITLQAIALPLSYKGQE